jgi:hypothetical protein
MLYRSPLTRLLLAVTGLLCGLLLVFGEPQKWRSTPSLHWLNQFPLPLQAWGIGFFLYAALLLLPPTRAGGFALGAFLYSVFTVSLLATLGDGQPKNIVMVAALTDVVVFHLYSIRTAEALRLSTGARGTK